MKRDRNDNVVALVIDNDSNDSNDSNGSNDNNSHNINLGQVGKAILTQPNLCDKSLMSEAVSGFRIEQLFTNAETQVNLWKTETDVKYWDSTCKKIDFIVTFTVAKTQSRVAIETKRISTFRNKVIVNQEIVNSILDNAFAKATDGLKYVCTPDRWSFCILHLLITEATTMELIDNWIKEKSQSNMPFNSIVITLVQGFIDSIF